MADDITVSFSSMKITEEEDKVVNLDIVETPENGQNLDLALVGKVLTVRNFNFDALKRTFSQTLAITSGALFLPIENNLFVVQFACRRDKETVLAGRPWTFDQNLVIPQEIDDHIQPSNIELKLYPFWARLYNLPMDCRT